MDITSILIIILGFIVIAEAIIIFIQYENNKSSKNSPNFTNEQHNSTVKMLTEAREKISELKEENEELKAKKDSGNESHYKQEYDKICRENDNLEKRISNLMNVKFDLEQKVKELKRDNDELNRIRLYGPGFKPPVTLNADTSTNNTQISEENEEFEPKDQQDSSQPTSQDPFSEEGGDDRNVLKENNQVESFKGITMYASFPRLAGTGNSVYFSDLSEKPAEDSYFELKVSTESDKAIFKPIDFMKIRNYDEAMAAMRTEGAKPNVATTVLGIISGEAHKENNDWVIEKLATIKLA